MRTLDLFQTIVCVTALLALRTATRVEARHDDGDAQKVLVGHIPKVQPKVFIFGMVRTFQLPHELHQ